MKGDFDKNALININLRLTLIRWKLNVFFFFMKGLLLVKLLMYI